MCYRPFSHRPIMHYSRGVLPPKRCREKHHPPSTNVMCISIRWNRRGANIWNRKLAFRCKWYRPWPTFNIIDSDHRIHRHPAFAFKMYFNVDFDRGPSTQKLTIDMQKYRHACSLFKKLTTALDPPRVCLLFRNDGWTNVTGSLY